MVGVETLDIQNERILVGDYIKTSRSGKTYECRIFDGETAKNIRSVSDPSYCFVELKDADEGRSVYMICESSGVILPAGWAE